MKAVIIIIVCSLMILSCEVDDSTISSSDLYYPMQERNVWKYLRTNQFENIVGDSLPITVTEKIDTSYALVWISGEKTIKDNLKTMVIKGIAVIGADIGDIPEISELNGSAMYYTQNKDGLYIYAYQSVGGSEGLVPKQSQKYQFRFNNNIYNSIDEIISDIHMDNPLNLFKTADDSLVYENPPV